MVAGGFLQFLKTCVMMMIRGRKVVKSVSTSEQSSCGREESVAYSGGGRRSW